VRRRAPGCPGTPPVSRCAAMAKFIANPMQAGIGRNKKFAPNGEARRRRGSDQQSRRQTRSPDRGHAPLGLGQNETGAAGIGAQNPMNRAAPRCD
jgi:hypothetical protein